MTDERYFDSAPDGVMRPPVTIEGKLAQSDHVLYLTERLAALSMHDLARVEALLNEIQMGSKNG